MIEQIGTNASGDCRPPDLADSPRLLDRMRVAIRRLHYSIRTEHAYIQWAKRSILFHGKQHPDVMGEAEVVAFLNHLAVGLGVAASTHNQAMPPILFLAHANVPDRLPVVLARDEVRAVFSHMDGVHRLAAGLMYGSGLRLMERRGHALRDHSWLWLTYSETPERRTDRPGRLRHAG